MNRMFDLSFRSQMAKMAGESPGEGAVIRLALFSRLLVLSLIFFWRFLFRPYDTSASINLSCLSPSSSSSTASGAVLWPRVGAAIEASVVWDGVYFVRIAECGYEYEQTYAFLPLLPACIALLSRSVFAPLVPIVGHRAVLALSGYVLNNLAFVFAAVYFYRLSLLLLNDAARALRASALFCFNPASIFYSSIYSESLYALLSLGGLYYLFSGANTIAMLLLALSGSARSNGALNAGYFCFQALLQAYDAIIQKKKFTVSTQAIFGGIMRSFFIFVPFLAFQAYAYCNICLGGASDKLRPWCNARVPHLYGFLQSHYWGVGFLRYFQVKQLPNFLLASPMLSLAACSVIHFARLLSEAFNSICLQEKNDIATVPNVVEIRESSDSISYLKKRTTSRSIQEDQHVRWRKQERIRKAFEPLRNLKSIEQFLQAKRRHISIFILPFALHLAFMTFTAFFVMHVQVSTRFLSASPLIYWFASDLLVSTSSTSRRCGHMTLVYFASFFLLGSLLFSNFYPFT